MSSRFADAVVLRAEELVTVTVAGTMVVHDPFEDRYVKLSPTAALLWEAIDPSACVGELVALLVERYGLEAERAARDVQALVESLAERGILRVAGAEAGRS